MELILDKIRDWTLEQGITQSELATKDACGFKWNLKYNNGLRTPGHWNWTTAVGTAVHEFMDLRYNGHEADPTIVRWPTIPEDLNRTMKWEDEYEYWTHVIIGMQNAYIRRYAHEVEEFDIDAAEQVVHRSFMGFDLEGMIDLRAKRLTSAKRLRKFMMDHKITTRPELMAPQGWGFKFQFMFYNWLISPLIDEPVWDFGINVIRKPQLRPAKTETMANFSKRCELDYYKRPEFYYLREFVPVTMSMVETFEETVLRPKLEWYRQQVEEGGPSLFNKNTNNCFMYNANCEFLDLCRDGDISLFMYEQTLAKHSELQGDKKHVYIK